MDPFHFVSAPSLFWATALRRTRVELQCFHKGQEPMYDFVEVERFQPGDPRALEHVDE